MDEENLPTKKASRAMALTPQNSMEELGACGPLLPADQGPEPLTRTSEDWVDSEIDEMTWRLSRLFREPLMSGEEDQRQLGPMKSRESGKDEFPGLVRHQIKFKKDKKAYIHRKLARVKPIAEASMEDDLYEPKLTKDDPPGKTNVEEVLVDPCKPEQNTEAAEACMTLEELRKILGPKVGQCMTGVPGGEKRNVEELDSDSNSDII